MGTSKKTIWFRVAGSLLGLVLLLWLIALAIAPANRMKQLKNQLASDTVFNQHFDSSYFDPDLATLVKEKAFKEALLQLSEDDSIQMVLNLSDSTLSLSIKGVILHQTPIEIRSVDKLLERLPLNLEVKLFSAPLEVLAQYATIVKEPVVVRDAPKDTLEAAQTAWQPDTLVQSPAYVAFSLEHQIAVIMEQDNRTAHPDSRVRTHFYSHLWYGKLRSSLDHFIHLQQQDYCPEICIILPVDDLRAIYRALPGKPYMVIKL